MPLSDFREGKRSQERNGAKGLGGFEWRRGAGREEQVREGWDRWERRGLLGDRPSWLQGEAPLHAGPSEVAHFFTMAERALDLESQCLSKGLSNHLLSFRYNCPSSLKAVLVIKIKCNSMTPKGIHENEKNNNNQ